MTNGSGVSRGDRNRNARLARLRELVPVDHAIVAIDLADKKQMVVVCDHDSKVLARKTFRCRAWGLGVALDWAAQRASGLGWAGVTISCEPTGHRWRVLGQLAADRAMPFVCVQPMVTSWARRAEDLTFDKTDDKDAVLIARLTAQLRCYVPEPVDETWGRLRHLGARRERLIVEAGAQVQQIRDLLECVWPAALETANWPFRSKPGPRRCGCFWTATAATSPGPVDLGRPGSRPRCGARSPGAADSDRACGSSARCSPHWPTRLACKRTAVAPWNGSNCCWRTGPTPTASWPTPRTG